MKVERLLDIEPLDAQNFTERDLELFVECIMSGNISDKYVNKSILAIALTLKLDIEEYEIYVEPSDEDELPPMNTSSEFFDFIDTSCNLLEVGNLKQKWCLYFRDFLIKKEYYEILHILDLEGRYSI